MTAAERSRRLRRAILAQLSKRAMTLDDLHGELDYLGDRAMVKKELLALARGDLIVGKYLGTHDRIQVYESWERVVERLRADRLRPAVSRRSGSVTGRRVA